MCVSPMLTSALPVCPCAGALVAWGACSSDSSDSRLPIIRRGEGSTEETYDESYADDREYHREDARSLSSDMYWTQPRRFASPPVLHPSSMLDQFSPPTCPPPLPLPVCGPAQVGVPRRDVQAADSHGARRASGGQARRGRVAVAQKSLPLPLIPG